MGTAALGTHGFLDAAVFTIPDISVPGCFYLEKERNDKLNINLSDDKCRKIITG